MIDPITEYILQEQKPLDEMFIVIPVIPGMEKVLLPVTAGLIGLAAIATAAGAISVRAKKKKFPKCKKYKVSSHAGHFHLCVAQEKIIATKQEFVALGKLKAQCGKTKDVEKCKNQVNKRMKKAQNKIQKLKDSLPRLKQWAEEERDRGN